MDLGGASKSALLQQQLPTALQLHILSFLSPNDRALSGRLVSPHIADALRDPQHSTAFLSQPLPPHAVPWAVQAGQQHVRQMRFWHKPHVLCTATASGSEANLEAALALLQPSVFPELLQHWYPYLGPDVGVAAVRAGHPQLLGWLLRRCPGLLQPDSVLRAAAQHCDLAGLRVVCNTLLEHDQRSNGGLMERLGWHQVVLNSAAESASPDASEKMQLLVATFRSCEVQRGTAVAAARCGDLDRLRWLHSRGCPMDNLQVLESALEHADLAVAAWLVDEAGCSLPAGGPADVGWKALLEAAVRDPGGLEKLAWLRERGAPSPTADLVYSAVSAGQAEVASFLLQLPGADAVLQERGHELGLAAVQSRSIPTVELLWRAGVRFTEDAYRYVAGSLAMVRWLTCHVEVPAAGFAHADLIYCWPGDTPAHSQDLLEAVQLLVDVAGDGVFPIVSFAALTTAAERGDLALVQYLLQQQRLTWQGGYQPNGKWLAAAAKGGCEALLEWLAEQHPGCLAVAGIRESPYEVAAWSGDRGTLEALRRLGVPWGADSVVLRVLWAEYPFPVLRWLVEQGAPMGSAGDMRSAVERGLARQGLSAEEAAWLRNLAPSGAA